MTIKSYNRINRQIPDNIKKKHPNFVKFLKAYYSWMEEPNSPYYHLRNHLSYLDFENSIDSYVDQLKNDFLFSLPQEILGNKELFIKYSKQFNLSIGTEESFKFLFNVLFEEDIQLYYPKTDILRASDGEWIVSEETLFLTDIDNLNNYVNKKIIQYNDLGNIQATAIVESINRRFVKKFKISEVVISQTKGVFLKDMPILIENDPEFEEYVMPVGLIYEIQNSGQNYKQGDVLKISNNEVFEKIGIANENGEFYIKISTSLIKNDIQLYINNIFIDPNVYEFENDKIYYNDILIGDEIKVVMPVYQGFIIVDVANQMGGIEKIKIIDTPVGINNTVFLEANDGGTGAQITLSYSPIKNSEGFYKNRKGFLSSDKVLQDSNYYQEFSYVIKTSNNIDKYKDIVMSVLHPAGMKMFGQINILSLLNLMITDNTLNIDKFIPAKIIISNKVSLGPTYSFFDKIKFFIDEDLAVIDDYSYLNLDNFDFNNNKKRFNIADFKQNFQACIDEYSEAGIYDFGYICEGARDNQLCVDDYADQDYYNFGYICDD